MTEEYVTAARMKQLERAANEAGLSYRQMMENAGYQAYREIMRRCPHPDSAVVFAGKGNNGGDGFVVARLLARDGVPVQVVLCEGAPVTADAAFAFSQLRDVQVSHADALEPAQLEALAACDVVVDALYGTGFHGALRPGGLRAAGVINRAAGLVCALDLPSGVNADTGEVAEGAVRAGLTVTFHARKRGQLAPRAALHCGEIVVAAIGITEALR